jgi:hypothetical protein
MTKAIIRTIQGRDWVLGMQWLTYDEVVSRPDLRADSDDMDASWFAERAHESVIQCGFCKPVGDIERPKKLSSLAAMLADVRKQPWLGVFDLGDGLFWQIAVRDHYAIQLDGDIVGAPDDIHVAAKKHSGFGGWTRVIGDVQMLADLIEEAKEKRTKPTPVNSFAVSRIDPAPLAIAVGVALLFAIAVSVGYHFHARHVVEEIAQNEKDEANKQAAKDRVPDAEQMAAGLPLPSVGLKACGDAMAVPPYSQMGWTISQTQCIGPVMKVTRTRSEGATVADTPPGMVLLDGDNGTQTLTIAPIPSAGAAASLTSWKRASRALLAWGQAEGIAGLRIDQPIAISPKALEGWSMNVTIPLPASPFEHDPGLDTIPGLRILEVGPTVTPMKKTGPGDTSDTTATVNGSQGVWTIKGVIYAEQ